MSQTAAAHAVSEEKWLAQDRVVAGLVQNRSYRSRMPWPRSLTLGVSA